MPVFTAVRLSAPVRITPKINRAFTPITAAMIPRMGRILAAMNPRSICIPTVTKKTPSRISRKGARSASIWWR